MRSAVLAAATVLQNVWFSASSRHIRPAFCRSQKLPVIPLTGPCICMALCRPGRQQDLSL
jgi:hypothetical protein